MTRKSRNIIIIVLLLAAAIMMMNSDASIRVGVNGHYRSVHMPLYVKWIQFLSRHYEYARLAKEITVGCKTDELKTLAILKWTRDNLKDVPAGMPVCDDHILNIIIRGHALPEQFQDVFTTLCTYTNIPAFYGAVYGKRSASGYYISLVMLNGEWCVFDAYRGIYFRTGAGEIADIDNIVKNPSIVSGKDVDTIEINGISYKDFFYNLSSISKPAVIRPDRQMPLWRLVYEARKALKIDRISPNHQEGN